MTLKNAALCAFVGMFLLTVFMAADFTNTVTGILHDAFRDGAVEITGLRTREFDGGGVLLRFPEGAVVIIEDPVPRQRYCLSKTKVLLRVLPAALVPLVIVV